LRDERYDRNVDAGDLLEIWEWCSRRLHVKWQRKRRFRNCCFIGITCALFGRTSITPSDLLAAMELPKHYKGLPLPLLDQKKVGIFWKVKPVALLELGLGVYTKASPLTQFLNRLRTNYQHNPTLDELAKKCAIGKNTLATTGTLRAIIRSANSVF
jgi:hypothetical protein